MFGIRWKPWAYVRPHPDATEWPRRASREEGRGEQVKQLSEELRSAIARADSAERPLFLRALGRDLETELRALSNRVAAGVSESGLELTKRLDLVAEWVDYYCEATFPWSPAPRPVELADCAREAIAGLSADMPLLLQVDGEPAVNVGRRKLVSLCELTIRAATTDAESEVQVVLPPCSNDRAELRVRWTLAAAPAGEAHDKARFLALAMAYVLKLGGTLRRTSSGAREGLVLQIPLRQHSDDSLTGTPAFDAEVIAQGTAFCG